jgi:hypothetical protein
MGASGLLLANVLYLVTGIGVVLLVGSAATARGLFPVLGLAYLAGIAVAGIVGAELALVDVAVGLPGIAALAALSLAAGVTRQRRAVTTELAGERPSGFGGGRAVAAACFVQLGLLLGVASTGFALRPIIDWDAWAVWGLKARALYELGGANNPVFFSPLYIGHNLDYPLFLPSLEAMGFRAMGSLDESLIHLQLLGIAVGFACTLWTLLRPRVPTEIAALAVLAVVAAPPVLGLLGTAYADVPLAFFVAVGLVALARWITESDGRLLVWAALFLGAAAMTKNEGGMFAIAAFAAAAVVLLPRARARLPHLALCAVGAFAPLVPWRVFLHVHQVHNVSFDLTNAANPSYLVAHADRVSPTVQSLVEHIGMTRFGLLVPLVALALLAGLLSRQFALTAFISGWLVLAFAAIVTIYWISPHQLNWYLGTSAYRTVVTLVIAAGSLAPLLIAQTWQELAAQWAARQVDAETAARSFPLTDAR